MKLKLALTTAASILALLTAGLCQAQTGSTDFVTLTGLNGIPVSPGPLVINLPTVTDATIPINSFVEIYGQLTNNSGQDVIISGFNPTTSLALGAGEIDLSLASYFQPSGGGFPSFVGNTVANGKTDTNLDLGAFNVTAFYQHLASLGGLPQSGVGKLDFVLNLTDVSNNSLPDVSAGSPSLLVNGALDPSGRPPVVPEGGSFFLLLTGVAPLTTYLTFRRRRK